MFQNSFLFTFLYCEILPLQVKAGQREDWHLQNFKHARETQSLLLFSSIQEKKLISNHSPITKEKTCLQSSD